MNASYFLGAVGMIWWIMWVKFVYETPQDHPSITKAELEYLETHLGPATKTKAQPVRQLLNNMRFFERY